jgi:membrane protein implicated in regulation of membrane protease activity
MEWLKDLLSPELIWFLIGLVLLIFEFLTPGLIIFFFGVGAWIVAIICLVTDIGINTQLIIFILCSVFSLLLLRRWIKGVFLGHTGLMQDLKRNVDEFVGQKAIVKEKIMPKRGGKVELHGTNWEAFADEEIEEGSMVEIISKENLTLKVKMV